MIKKVVLFMVVMICIACGSQKKITTIGIRHDKNLSDYEKVATNKFPYNTKEYTDFSSVVALKFSMDGTKNLDFIATGVLIAPNWVLTAGHNFYLAAEDDKPIPKIGIQVLTGNDPNTPKSTHWVEELIFHPTWLTVNKDFLKANDLCLLKLETPVIDVKPAKLNISDTEEIGSIVWFSGFGNYAKIVDNRDDILSKKHAIQNTLDRKNSDIISKVNGKKYTGGLLAYDFDDGKINSLGDAIVNTDESTLGEGTSDLSALAFEGTTIVGDRGPLFVTINKEWSVGGILSGGALKPVKRHVDGSYGEISAFLCSYQRSQLG